MAPARDHRPEYRQREHHPHRFGRALPAASAGLRAAGPLCRLYGGRTRPAGRVCEPSHPEAGADGYVSYPAIDHAGEMTRMVATARIYEANLVAMSIARQMYAKAVEIGRRG